MRRKQWAIVTGIAILLVVFVYTRTRPFYVFLTSTLGVSPISLAFGKPEVANDAGKTNFVLLGIPDDDSDGPNLSDSIMFIQYDRDSHTLTTLGIPRDYWSPTLEDKINTAYAIGEARKAGSGLTLAKTEIEEIVGQPVHYGVVVSFGKFEQLIDVLGGIEVDVERSFTDNEFPIKGKENDECFGDENYECRYQTVSFSKGKQHMNGATALKFVRSRHAEGVEGSDFARNARQQKVMDAVKTKLAATLKKGDIKTIRALYDALDKLVIRDLDNPEAAVLAKSVALGGELRQINLDFPRQMLEVPNVTDYGAYVLIPENRSALERAIRCALREGTTKGCYPAEETEE
jgi:LCP family protein required for cell wall assembly